jgi:hypothetical protein
MKRPENYDLGSDNDIDTDANCATHIKKKIATMATAIQLSLRAMIDLNMLSTPKAAVRASPAKYNKNSRPLKAFHHFADLPHELQDEVWKWASYASPNTVSIMIDDEVVRFVATAMIVPAILQATSGSRGIALHHYTLVCIRGAFFPYSGMPQEGFLLIHHPLSIALETSALETCLGSNNSNPLPEGVIANFSLTNRSRTVNLIERII